MSKLENEVVIEGLREDFYHAINDGDFDLARASLKELEDMKVSTYELRREMNRAMDEDAAKWGPDDYTNSSITNYGL